MSAAKGKLINAASRFFQRVPHEKGVDPQQDKLGKVESRLKDLETSCEQLQDALSQAAGLLPPPAHLQIRVSGVYDASFIRHGESLRAQLGSSLASIGKDFRSFQSILDFGCGCGRVLRAVHAGRVPSQQLYGTDIDVEAIDWCRKNYAAAAKFSANPALPPTGYREEMFDFVYSVSTFTHLPEEMQFSWLAELRRVTRAGGLLLLTTHGRKHIEKLPSAERETAIANGFWYCHAGNTAGLPGFYQVAYHMPEYIRQRWSEFFEIVDVCERALDDHQDIVICRAI